MIEDIAPYAIAFASTLAATLALTPLVRSACRRFGMVDMPDPRRINKKPVPRGGGVAVVVGVLLPYVVFHAATGRPLVQGLSGANANTLVALASAIALVGLVDDKWSLRPKLKLAFQLIVAFLAWWWAGLGFRALWPMLPAWFDCLLTVCWIVGAVNAFNLIDGLDGLATGLAFIATLGMAGTMFFSRNPQAALFHIAFAGGLLGFLRYNYNPASIFLGDCGALTLGFALGTISLLNVRRMAGLTTILIQLVIAAVPIIDTFSAIVRRKRAHVSVGHADKGHLHHRLILQQGYDQRQAVLFIYGWTVLLCAGNIKGAGEALTRRIRDLGKEAEPWQPVR